MTVALVFPLSVISNSPSIRDSRLEIARNSVRNAPTVNPAVKADDTSAITIVSRSDAETVITLRPCPVTGR